jgi:hypothetical protein
MSQYPGGQYPGGQYPGGQPPYDPYYGRPPDPYAPPQQPEQPPQPSDPYFGQPPASDPTVSPRTHMHSKRRIRPGSSNRLSRWQSQQPPPRHHLARGAGQALAWPASSSSCWAPGSSSATRSPVDLGQTWPALAVGLGIIMVIAAFIPRRG